MNRHNLYLDFAAFMGANIGPDEHNMVVAYISPAMSEALITTPEGNVFVLDTKNHEPQDGSGIHLVMFLQAGPTLRVPAGDYPFTQVFELLKFCVLLDEVRKSFFLLFQYGRPLLEPGNTNVRRRLDELLADPRIWEFCKAHISKALRDGVNLPTETGNLGELINEVKATLVVPER